MRVIVTGSRHWTDVAEVEWALRLLPSDAVIVHGAARGLDTIAAAVAVRLGLRVEEHPADWNRLGVKAGPIRNQAMVDSGADACLAFPESRSIGTWDCVRRADAAGIPVTVHYTGEIPSIYSSKLRRAGLKVPGGRRGS